MKRLLLLAALMGVFPPPPTGAGAPPFPEIAIGKSDRILILAPHPDDEVIGCGGVIRKALELDLPLQVVFFTHGDNNEWAFALYRKHPVLEPSAIFAMGEMRHAEALNAARILGVATNQILFLGYPDFRTLTIWTRHWKDEPACRGMLNHSLAVPYPEARRPGSPHKGEAILQDLTAILLDFKPTRIFVSHPADKNPDHRALYLFTQTALWQLDDTLSPGVYPYLVHFPHWPVPRGFNPAQFLDPPPELVGRISWWQVRVSPANRQRLVKAIEAHRTQISASRHFLQAFIRPNFLYGDFPLLAFDSRTANPDNIDSLLSESDNARFLGHVERQLTVENRRLTIGIRYTASISETLNLTIHAFGFRRDVPFETMSKIRVEVGALNHRVFDQSRELPRTACIVTRHLNSIEIGIPLSLLNDPQRVWTGADVRLGELPLDHMAWRAIQLAPDPMPKGAP